MSERRYPEPTVGTLIFGPDGRFLLVRSPKWVRNRWVIPGGHIELGERMVEAAVREAKEETGLDVRDLALLCVQECIYDGNFHERRHFVFFDFVCRADSLAVVLNEEGERYMWAALEEADSLPIEKYTRHVIDTYVARYGRRAWVGG
jgi:nucleoside triphosphatase